MEGGSVTCVPRGAQFGIGDVPVRAHVGRHLAQVAAQIVDRRAAPKPVAVVDAVHDEPRLQDDRVRDHRVLGRVGVLGDVEILLDDAPGIGQERPGGADGRTELVELEQVVGADGDDLRVADGDLGVGRGELEVLLMVLGAEVASGQDKDHRTIALELAEGAPLAGVVGQLVVGEPGPRA